MIKINELPVYNRVYIANYVSLELCAILLFMLCDYEHLKLLTYENKVAI